MFSGIDYESNVLERFDWMDAIVCLINMLYPMTTGITFISCIVFALYSIDSLLNVGLFRICKNKEMKVKSVLHCQIKHKFYICM